MTTTKPTAATVHKFEAAGLGKAPFRYVGMEEKVYVSHPGAKPGPGGSCDYCGMGIRYVFYVVSADGIRFGVGCDCIRKVGDAGLNRVIADDERKLEKAKRDARAAAKIAAARDLLPTVRDRLAGYPHPSHWMAEKGCTLLTWVEWMFANAGQSGKLDAARVIEAEAAKVG